MGLMDKISKAVETAKDILDDGKLNGSAGKAKTGDPAPEEKPAAYA